MIMGRQSVCGGLGFRPVLVVLSVVVWTSALVILSVSPALASTTYYPSSWNGYKIYLSPSSQTGNIGCDGFNEATYAAVTGESAAFGTEVSLGFLERGYQVRIGTGTVSQRIADSNSYSPRYHIPLHSNATSGCPGTRGGTETYNYYGSQGGSLLAQEILDRLGPRSPGTSDKRLARTGWAELDQTNAVTAYVESGFHDWPADEDWLRTYGDWAWVIAMAVDIRLGYP